MESILSTHPHPNLPNFESLVSKGIPSMPFSGSSIEFYDHSNPYKASALKTYSKDFLNVSISPASNGKVELRQDSNNMQLTNIHSTTLVASVNQESFYPHSTFLKIQPEPKPEPPEPKPINSVKDVSCGVNNVEHGHHKKSGHNKNHKKVQAKVIIDPKGPQEKISKGQWSPEEDRSLIQLVKRHGARNWTKIARMLSGRVGKQCRDRWENHLRPEIKKGAWSEEEEKLLIKLHMQIGGKWSEIARRMPSRSENTIKNHWYATKRKHSAPSKIERNSNLLYNYIRSLSSTSREYDHNDFEDISVSDYSNSQEVENIPLAQQENANFELDQDDDIPYIPLSLVVDQHNSEVQYEHDPPYLSTSLDFDERKEMDFFEMLFEDFP